ncbi:hypothetical protein [Herbaspirillum sp. SJZ107]|uniref:hypothetical protein n=1 Tax=Herbaspirillum sp. SJZ107 TaxID=2572881 RepID=UPI00114DAE5B|nr:hypothetical protein [Herbaspirillum sp. SJZ107]TQK05546.1 hypothetical protein FBX97_4523 [Herbaspirillum sp. SJZ107]
MRKTALGMALMAFLSVGCAPMMPAPADRIQTLPVVKMGEAFPSGTEYVLYIPANSPIPIKIATQGTLLKNEQSVVGSTSFTRDLYIYKYWSSYDRKTWENSHRLLNVSFAGGMDASGLNVNVTLDQNR